MEPSDTAAAAAPAKGSAAETDKTAEETNPEITATEQIECLSLSQPIVLYHHPPN